MAAGAPEGALWVVEPDEQRELLLEAALGTDPARVPGILRADDTPAGRALASGEAVTAAGGGLHLPLVAGGRVVALASLSGADEDGDRVPALARQVAVALSNVVSLRSALRSARLNRAVLDADARPRRPLRARRHPRRPQRGDGRSCGHATRAVDAPGEDDREVRRPRRPRLLALRRARPGRRRAARMGRHRRPARRHRRARGRAAQGRVLRARLPRAAHAADVDHRLPRARPRRRGGPARPTPGASSRSCDRNARRLLRLVGDMLFVAQVEAGRLSLERAPRRPRPGRRRRRRGRAPGGRARRRARSCSRPSRSARSTGDRDRFGQIARQPRLQRAEVHAGRRPRSTSACATAAPG